MPKKIILSQLGTAFTGAEGEQIAGIRIEFDDHKADAPSFSDIMLSELPAHIVARALAHGVSQKAGDSYAGAKDEPDPVAFAKASVADVFKALRAGDWRTATIGTGGSRVSDFAKAVAAVTGKPIEEVMATLAEMTDEQKKPIKDNPAVKAALANIKAEAAIAKAAKLGEKAKAEGIAGLTF